MTKSARASKTASSSSRTSAGTDLTLFSPRASWMGHHFGNELISRYWTEHSNDLIYRVTQALSRTTSSACASCRNRQMCRPKNCIPELERCVTELGFVGCNLSPDTSGGYWQDPPLTDRYWYPLYEKMVELDVPAMVHVSATCNPAFHQTGSHYLNADTTAFMQFVQQPAALQGLSDPAIHHSARRRRGPYHWGRYRGMNLDLGRPSWTSC